ncbi:MAG: hypothetical protein ACYDAG_00475 [Chloroflexota bacterium]
MIVPRLLLASSHSNINEDAVAKRVLEECRYSMMRNRTITDAFEKLRGDGGEAADLALDYLVMVDRGERMGDALETLSHGRQSALRQALRQMKTFLDEGYWGPTAAIRVEQMIDALVVQHKLHDRIRVGTQDVRRFRRVSLVMLPLLALVMLRQNPQMFASMAASVTGLIALMAVVVIYVAMIVVTRWRIPNI